LALLGAAVMAWRRRRARTAPARLALLELSELRARLARDGDTRGFVAAVSLLLRRLALARYPRERVAGLNGPDWLAFLDDAGGGGRFREGPGRALADCPYRPAVPGAGEAPELDSLVALAADWIRAHREIAP
jgi:hypothetical protein